MGDRVNERMRRLLDVFRSAEADVDASQKRLREASAARLAELLRRPPADRIQAVRDPALTAFDRATLERSLEDALDALDARRVRWRWTVSGSSIRRFGRHHRRALLRVSLAVASPAFFAASTWVNTPPVGALPVMFTADLAMRWTMPNGRLSTDVTASVAGTEAVWFMNGSKAKLRHWFPRQGYGTMTDLTEEYFARGLIVQR